MIPNGHILKLFYQKLFQTRVEYHSDTMITKDIHVVIDSSFIQDERFFCCQNSFVKAEQNGESIQSELSLFGTFSKTR